MAENLFGIIACPLFEDEIVHELKNDDSVERVYIIEDEFSGSILEKASSRLDKPFEPIPLESIGRITDSPGTVLVWMKDVGLHVRPEELKESIIGSIRVMEAACSTILLFYGICGNALDDFDAIAPSFDSRVFILRDEGEGRIVDDCVAAVVGGASNYLKLMKDHTGEYYLSPGWAEHFKDILGNDRMLGDSGISYHDFTKMLLDAGGYEKALKIHTPIEDPRPFDESVRRISEEFDLEVGDMDGNLDVIDHTYTNARKVHLGCKVEGGPVPDSR